MVGMNCTLKRMLTCFTLIILSSQAAWASQATPEEAREHQIMKQCEAQAIAALKTCTPIACEFRNIVGERMMTLMGAAGNTVRGRYEVKPEGPGCRFIDTSGPQGSMTSTSCLLNPQQRQDLSTFLHRSLNAQHIQETGRAGTITLDDGEVRDVYNEFISQGICQ